MRKIEEQQKELRAAYERERRQECAEDGDTKMAPQQSKPPTSEVKFKKPHVNTEGLTDRELDLVRQGKAVRPAAKSPNSPIREVQLKEQRKAARESLWGSEVEETLVETKTNIRKQPSFHRNSALEVEVENKLRDSHVDTNQNAQMIEQLRREMKEDQERLLAEIRKQESMVRQLRAQQEAAQAIMTTNQSNVNAERERALQEV